MAAGATWALRRVERMGEPGRSSRPQAHDETRSVAGGPRAPELAGTGGVRSPSPARVLVLPGFRGVVLDARTSAPVAGAQVEAFAFAPLGKRLTARSRHDGTFELSVEGLAFDPGLRALRLVVSHPEFAPATIDRQVATPGPIEIRLEPAGWIVGEVASGDGASLPDGLRVHAQRRVRFGGELAASVLRRRLGQVVPPEVRRAGAAVVDNGRFRLGPLAAGRYAVGLVAAGLPVLEIAGAQSHDVESGALVVAGETLDLGRIVLAGPTSSVVRVLDGATEAPLTTATFHGEREMDRATEPVPLAVVPIQPPGSYRVPLWPTRDGAGLGDLVVSAPGYGAVSSAYVNHFDEGPLLVRLHRTAALRGRVLTTGGEPAGGALVLVSTGVDDFLRGTATADASGAFSVDGLTALQQLEVRVLSADAGRELFVAGLTLEPGETRELLVGGGGAATLHGRITRGGEPLPDILVSLDTPDDRRLQTVTGADGAYAFAALEPGRHVVFLALQAGGYAERRLEVAAGRAVRADVELTATLSGTVRVESLRGEPVERARLGADAEVVARSRGDDEGWRLGARLAEAGDGRFTLLLPELPAGHAWALAVEEDHARTLVPVEVALPRPPEAPPVVLPVTLDPQDAVIRLTLVDDVSGAPIPDASYQAAYRTTSAVGTLPGSGVLEEDQAGFGAYVYVFSAPRHVSQEVRFELTARVRAVTREVRLVPSNAVRIVEVTGPGAAADAGLRAGDLITHYGGEPVPSVLALRERLGAAAGATDPVEVEGLRAGAPLRVSVRSGRLGVRLENARS